MLSSIFAPQVGNPDPRPFLAPQALHLIFLVWSPGFSSRELKIILGKFPKFTVFSIIIFLISTHFCCIPVNYGWRQKPWFSSKYTWFSGYYGYKRIRLYPRGQASHFAPKVSKCHNLANNAKLSQKWQNTILPAKCRLMLCSSFAPQVGNLKPRSFLRRRRSVFFF